MAPFLNSPPPLSLLPVERGLGRKKREPGATQHRRVFQQLSMWRRCVQTAGGPSPVRSDVVSITESNLNSWALSFDHFWPLRLSPTSTCCWDRTGLSLDVQEAGDIEDRYRSHLDRGCPKLSLPLVPKTGTLSIHTPHYLAVWELVPQNSPAKSKTENNNGRAGGPGRDLPYREPLPGPRIGGTGERKRKALGGGQWA